MITSIPLLLSGPSGSHVKSIATLPLLEWWDQGSTIFASLLGPFRRPKPYSRASIRHLYCNRCTLSNNVLSKAMRLLSPLCAWCNRSCARLPYMRPEAHTLSVGGGRQNVFFFCNLASTHRSHQSMCSIQDPATGHVHHDAFEILGVWQHYYTTLFTAEVCDLVAQDVMLQKLTRWLSEAEHASCEGGLTFYECFTALQGMAHGKTPGSDGFPMEFYVHFWQLLGVDLVCVLNVASEAGQLPTCQRRGLIIVLYKKNDRLDTKNWRPISLLNIDYTIATRAISGRLLGVLSSIVGLDQTCGVCGRTISENLFLIRDVLEYVEQENLLLALLSLN